jgi:hypothetical protein
MIHKARDLSPDQKTAIESLLGRAIAEDEAISIRTTAGIAAPEWLQASWESARQLGLDTLSPMRRSPPPAKPGATVSPCSSSPE